MKIKTKRIILATILLLTCFLDILTYSVSKFKVLEANPVLLLTGSLLFFLSIKILVNIYLSWRMFVPKLHKSLRHQFFISFFHVTMITILMVGQCVGIYANVTATNSHQNQLDTQIHIEQEKTPEIPLNESQITNIEKTYIKSITYTKESLIKEYFRIIGITMLYPIIFTLINFVAWLHVGSIEKWDI